ncbi:1674_t:CDS:2, partial [Acaulospora colombiana]
NAAAKTSNGVPGDPKSFVIKHGQVGYSITQLVRDMRKVMEPNTASRLRERGRNKLKDYIVLGPTLQVTHILAFSLTPKSPTLRIVRLPSGPSLSFRIERYSLVKDVLNSKKRKRSKGLEYLTPPLLVLAAFPPAGGSASPHLSLLVKSFQSIFPSLSPQTISLSSARRVVLVHYNEDRDSIDFRHYLITVRAQGVSRRVRKLLEGATTRGGSVLDLGNEKDVADYILRQAGQDGYETASSYASDAGEDGGDNKIELPSNYVGRNNRKGEQRVVSLEEIGPRMELKLLKITEGMPGKEGSVIWHRFVKKSASEIKAQKLEHAERSRLREQRRREQEENVARKRQDGQVPKDGEKEDPSDEEMDEGEVESGNEEDEGEWDDEEDISEDESEDDLESRSNESDDDIVPTKKGKR